MDYICSNCGNVQQTMQEKSGCAYAFWSISITITIMVSLFYWVGFIILALEIILSILTKPKSNCCHKCQAHNCMMPVNTPRGQELFDKYYEYEEIEEQEDTEENLEEEIPAEKKNEEEFSFTKIKIEKCKTAVDIIQENKVIIILVIGTLFILWTLYIMLLPLRTSNNSSNNLSRNPIPNIDKVQAAPIKKVPQTLENSPQIQAQYKAEIEKTINIGVTKAKKEIDQNYEEANLLYTHIINNDDYTVENYNKYEAYTRAIESPIFWLYYNLVDITERYTNTHKDLATGWYGALADYIEPSMKKYGVSNLNKLTELEQYMDIRYKEIDARAKGLWDITYNSH